MKRFLSRIKNILILTLCLLRFVFKGKSNKQTRNVKRVLVVQVAKLGDMICTTPMFRAVKSNFPEAKVFVCGNTINREVLAGNMDVDGNIVFTKKVFQLLSLVKKEKF